MGSICCVGKGADISLNKDFSFQQFKTDVKQSERSRLCFSERLLKVKIKTISGNTINNCEKCLKLIHKNKAENKQFYNNFYKQKRNIPNPRSASNVFEAVGRCSEFFLTYDDDSVRQEHKNFLLNAHELVNFSVKELPNDICDKLIVLFQNNFLFEGITIDQLALILPHLVEVNLEDGQEIYKKDFEGNFFFIVAEGKVNLIENGNVIKTYNQWDSFGHLSLLCETTPIKMEYSAHCVGRVVLYVLDNSSYHKIQKELIKMRLEEQYNFVKQIPIFCNLDAITKYTLAEKILIKEYELGNVIINEKNKSSESYLKYHSHNNFSRIKSSKSRYNTKNSRYNHTKDNSIDAMMNDANDNLNQNAMPPAHGSPESNLSAPSSFLNEVLFLIKEGKVTIEKQGKKIVTLSTNDYFGVSSILFDTPPSKRDKISIIAIEPVVCYEITKTGLIEALGFNYKEIILFSIFKHIIQNNKYFNLIFGEKQLLSIFKVFRLMRYYNREEIFCKTLAKKRMIIIIDGNIRNQQTKQIIAKTGDIIGEEFFNNKHSQLCPGLIAFPHLITLESEVQQIFNILNLDKECLKQVKELKKLNRLKRISLFKYLPHDLIEKISNTITIEKYNKDEKIIVEGEKGDKCYFITKGCVGVYAKNSSVFIRELEKGNFFGERALIHHNDIRTATVIANSKVSCFVLSKQNFNLIFNDDMTRKYIEKKISIQKSNITLKDLYYIKHIGKGRFGNVILVHNTKDIYALKIISIKQVSKDKIGPYVLSEKTIMRCLDHPFIIKSVKTLKDDFFVYFLIEYINGQTFENFLRNRCMFKQLNELQFYMACLLIILEYLNSKNVVHRDIKPGNIMLDKQGYMHLIDFGTAKIVNDYTSTVIGTPEYTAPEIIQGKGYSLSCDFWSIGIIAYEIYYGKCPFNGSDALSIYKNVMNQEIKYETKPDSREANDFIFCLLQRNVNKRTCNITELKEKDLFHFGKGSDNNNNNNNVLYKKDYFEMIMNCEIKAPYNPAEIPLPKNTFNSYKELVKDYMKKVFVGEGSTVSSSAIINRDNDEIDIKWLESF